MKISIDRQFFRTTPIGWIIIAIALVCVLLVNPERALARGGPEYMRLNYVAGIALEVKGHWDTSGAFIAEDIEQLPNPRSPKLRGQIQSINKSKNTLTILGRTIHLTKSTRFVEPEPTQTTLASLKVGQHIEVSCTIRDDGSWKARKIKSKNVKTSSKIKGSITQVSVDGTAPDTLIIHGLIIILNEKTDINWPRGELDKLEYRQFKYAALSGAELSDDGVVIGKGLLLTAKYRGQMENASEYDLQQNFGADRSDVQPGLRLELTTFLTENISGLAQVRWRKRYALDTDSLAVLSESKELNITQLYVLFRKLGDPHLALQVGRQDFDEPREWLFDDYLDAIRFHYIATEGFVAQAALIVSVSPIKDKFDSWTDYFAQVGWRFDKHSVTNAYVLKRKDTSLRNREPIWWGLRYFGRPAPSFRSWFDIAIMRGEDKGRSQSAWAVDFGTTYRPVNIGAVKPSLTVGYAIGSGDKVSGDPESQEFRQTGYQDNVATLGGVSSVRYYGEALNPELSNIKILTAGLGAVHQNGASLETIYHSYKQHRLDPDLAKTALLNPPARPNGSSVDLGWGVDVIATSPEFWERFQLRYTLSVFKPGLAFDPRQETALLNRLNVDVTL